MQAREMKPLKVYRALTDSPDGTIQKGDVLWISENGNLNLAGFGWLNDIDFQSSDIIKFSVVEANDYSLYVVGDAEICIKKNCEIK